MITYDPPVENHLCPNCDKNPAEAPHPCPYQSEINSDEKPCTCCAACTQECALDV